MKSNFPFAVAADFVEQLQFNWITKRSPDSQLAAVKASTFFLPSTLQKSSHNEAGNENQWRHNDFFPFSFCNFSSRREKFVTFMFRPKIRVHCHWRDALHRDVGAYWKCRVQLQISRKELSNWRRRNCRGALSTPLNFFTAFPRFSALGREFFSMEKWIERVCFFHWHPLGARCGSVVYWSTLSRGNFIAELK